MKKKVFILACLILGVVSVYQKSQTQSSVDEFLLMNVEALAADESIFVPYCVGSGNLDCWNTSYKVELVYDLYSLRK